MPPFGTARRRLAQVARGRSARSSGWAMVGQVSAIVASTANFLLLARIVGPAEYGLITGTWALVLAVSPIAMLGADRLLVRDVSARGAATGRALGAGLATLAAGWVVVLGGLVLLRPVVLPQSPLLLMLSLAVADIVALGVVALVSALCFATGNARAAAVVSILVNLTKLLAVVTFAVSDADDPVTWALVYAGLALLGAVGQLAWAVRRFGRPSLSGYSPVTRVREGLPYSGHLVATVVQNDADKTLLLRAGLAVEAGLYSVAYRLVSMAFMPVLAVLQAMFPRFFAVGGSGGISATAALGKRLVKPLLAYGLLAVGLLVAVAPLIPIAVGEEFRPSSALLMLIAPLVLFKVVQTVTGDVLTGSGRQGTRTACVAAAAVTNVAVNLVLIPLLGLTGAIVATYVAELTQATLVVLAVRRGLVKDAASRAAEPTEPAEPVDA